MGQVRRAQQGSLLQWQLVQKAQRGQHQGWRRTSSLLDKLEINECGDMNTGGKRR
jgi:hypothetical protein